MSERFYITTPIYYVNDEPHIGHAYTTIAADVMARYNRLLGRETFFLTGNDEHGQKLQDTARAKGYEPKEYCDLIVVRFIDTWKKLNISNNDFIRTTEPRHIEVVQNILQQLYDKGEIYKGSYEGWYSKSEERFWTEKDLIDGKCPLSGNPVEKIVEEDYFFRMSKYRDWLIEYIEEHPTFIQPDFRRNEVLGYLKQPLADLCISRPKKRLQWGIEIPFDREYVCYVWFDALLNYITAPGYLSDREAFEKWWRYAVHLIGKDILTTHSVYWPCMLKAAGIPLPRMIFAHGYWLMADAKMSKSKGNVVKPLDLADVYGVDSFRYFMMREMTMGQDSSYSEQSFISRYNSDLANDFGNLVSRLTKMIKSYTDGILPEPGSLERRDREVETTAKYLSENIVGLIDGFKINSAIEDIMQLVRLLNRYVESNRPWELHKKGNRDRLNTVLYIAAEGLRIAARLLYPVMPVKIEEFASIFNYDIDDFLSGSAREWGWMKPGREIKKGDALFPRIEIGKQAPPKEAASESRREKQDYIEFDDFKKLNLKVARVVSAEKVEGADKLLKLQIDLGSEKRQIVAGVAEYYKPEDLEGLNIIVLTNLKPVKIRGIESNGMLLAAEDKRGLSLVTLDSDRSPGSSVS